MKSMNSAWLTVLCSLTLSINFCCCEILLRFWKACTHLFSTPSEDYPLKQFSCMVNNTFVTSELCIFPESVLRYSLSLSFIVVFLVKAVLTSLLLILNY